MFLMQSIDFNCWSPEKKMLCIVICEVKLGKTETFIFYSGDVLKLDSTLLVGIRNTWILQLCHWKHIKLIKMLSVLIASSALILTVYLHIKLTVEPNWKGDMCGLKWEKIVVLKLLKLHHCIFPNKKFVAPFEGHTLGVLIESDSFVIISLSNNSCVAFFPLIIHCVLIHALISVSLTQNCQVRMTLSSTADCELLILSSFMYSSVPYADRAPPWKLVLCSLLRVLESVTDVLSCETGSQVDRVGLFAVQPQCHECKTSLCHDTF